MATDINNSTVVGRLTRDGELKYTNSGTAVLKFSIANNWSKKVGDNWEDQTNFFDISLWGKRAESLAQYLTKGTQVGVMGVLRQDRWEQDGQQRSRVYINAENIQLLGSKNDNQQSGQQGNQRSYHQNNSQPSYKNYPQGNQGGSGNFEDDIPF